MRDTGGGARAWHGSEAQEGGGGALLFYVLCPEQQPGPETRLCVAGTEGELVRASSSLNYLYKLGESGEHESQQISYE